MAEWLWVRPPYRPSPETVRRMMGTQLATLMLPAGVGFALFGLDALGMMVAGALAGAGADWLAGRARGVQVSGSVLHGAMMGLLVAFMLPVEAGVSVAVLGAAAGVVVGKQFFGGLGHYVWHPALVGRAVVELFFHGRLGGATGAVLGRDHLFWGDWRASVEGSWGWLEWFGRELGGRGDAWQVARPGEVLRSFEGLEVSGHGPELGGWMAAKLPGLAEMVWGTVPGEVGATCGAVLALVGVYWVYRGYLRWELPVGLIVGAYVAAALLPIAVGEGAELVAAPLTAERLAAGVTYVHYQVLAGGVLLAGLVLVGDTTSRPVAARGQVVFAVGAGVLAMVFRLYTAVPMPVYASLLVWQSVVAVVDSWSRPRGKKIQNSKFKIQDHNSKFKT